MSRHKHRTAIAVGAGLLVMAIGVLFFSGSALAYPLVNVPATHTQATLNTINNRPNLVNAVLSVWPAFYVKGGAGGYACNGVEWLDIGPEKVRTAVTVVPYIAVNTLHLTGKAYTHQVAEEWCHEVWLAVPQLMTAWREFMATTWPQVDTSGWAAYKVPGRHNVNLWSHTLMESMRQAWWYPYYANGPEYRVYATRAQMTVILQSCGVTP